MADTFFKIFPKECGYYTTEDRINAYLRNHKNLEVVAMTSDVHNVYIIFRQDSREEVKE